MKTKYFLVFLVLLLSVVFHDIVQAQSCLVMEYDADGNRISRQVTTNCIEKREIAEVQETETYEDVDVYPNPNNGMFIIIMQDCVKQEAACYELFDVNGMMLLSGKLHENETEVDVGTVPVGVYLLRIKNGENVISKVIVIN